MTKQSFRKSLWILTSSFLLALLLLPTSSFAQRGTKDTKSRAQATTRTTAKKDFNNRRNYSSANRTTATRRTTTARTNSQPTRRTATKPTSRRTTTATSSRTNRTTTNRRAARRDNDVVTRSTATSRANSGTVNNRRPAARADVNRTATRTTSNRQRSTNYVYVQNTRNDYCNNFYRTQNNWNRNFWTSVNYGYAPNYFDTFYNRFPSVNNLRAERFRHFGTRYWLYDGIWFNRRFGRYYAVEAPIGLRLNAIPTGGDLIQYRGDRFVIYRGTTYRMLPFGGFEIVRRIDRF